MRKCENYMFCKPAGITLQSQFQLRIISDTGNIDVNVSETKQKQNTYRYDISVSPPLGKKHLLRRWSSVAGMK